MGIQPMPIGTLDELRKEGINPAFVGSCSPPSSGVGGCKSYDSCIFRFKKNGGFRDNGPRNCGYYHRTHEGRAVENDCSCAFFMSRMYDRMRAGERDRQDGKNGEIIQIIAIEGGMNHPLSGEPIHRTMTINENEGTNLAPKWVKKTITGPVPKFPRPADRQTVSYDTLVEDRRRMREAQNPDLETGPSEPVHRVQPANVDPDPVIDLGEVLEAAASGPAPVARPVGRPRKVREVPE
jgi:hypothetical protein